MAVENVEIVESGRMWMGFLDRINRIYGAGASNGWRMRAAGDCGPYHWAEGPLQPLGELYCRAALCNMGRQKGGRPSAFSGGGFVMPIRGNRPLAARRGARKCAREVHRARHFRDSPRQVENFGETPDE